MVNMYEKVWKGEEFNGAKVGSLFGVHLYVFWTIGIDGLKIGNRPVTDPFMLR